MTIKYKKSPVGEIPIDWLCNTLGNIATVKGGKRMPKGTSFSESKTQYPYIRVSDFINGTVSTNNLKYVLEEDREKIKRYTISINDLYISIAGSIGIVGSVPEVLDGSQLTENAAKIIFNNNLKTTKNYYKHFLQSDNCQSQFIQETGTGGGVPKLALFRIENTYIPCPPLPEQKKIAKILTSVDEVIETTEAQINKLKDLKKGMMNELLTKGIGHTEFKDSAVGRIPMEWKVKKLGALCEKITDGSHLSPKTVKNGLPIATVENMKDYYIDISSCRTIGHSDFDALLKNTCSPNYNDVLFSKDGTVGKTFVYKQMDKIVLLSSIAIITTKKGELFPDYLTQFLKSPLFYDEIENSKTGSAIRRIILRELKNLPITFPSFDEQQKIAKNLTSIDTNIDQKQIKLTQTKNLKKSLMADLLTGRVRVNLSENQESL